MALRDYQQDIKNRVSEAWRSHGSVMLQMPTGTGKTHVLASVIREFAEENLSALTSGKGVVWIIAHRRELVAQIEATIARYGIGEGRVAVRTMSIQWLSRHWADAGGRPALIVIDEAHHALAATYAELWRRYPSARKLGLTATPCRMSGRGFIDLFEVLLTSWSIPEFILRGHLSLFDYVSISAGSREQRQIECLAKRSADGDYQVKEMDAVLNRRPNIARLYESVERYARGRKGIVYAISIDHARRIADYYRERGIPAEAIDSRTPSRERQRLVEAFREGRIRVLVNVDVFSEGFDCPDVEFVQMARPTLSLAKYLQQVGRGLRRATGKETCVLIDNVGLYRLFGLPTRAWDWEAMFRGEAPGKVRPVPVTRQGASMPPVPSEATGEEAPMRQIVSHEDLLESLREPAELAAPQKPAARALAVWQDKRRGLWGLKSGDKKITEAVYAEVFDLRPEMAAVRFGNGLCGVVDSTGRTSLRLGDCRSMKFLRNHFLHSVLKNGRICYTDLYSLRTYEGRPEVRRYGTIELLKQGDVLYSRTRRVYEISRPVDRRGIFRHGFYLLVPDSRTSSAGSLPEDFPGAVKGGYVCLLEGDYESYYYMRFRLEDGSIIVSDNEERYYHARAGREKQYIGHRETREAEVACLTRIGELAEVVRESLRQAEVVREEKRRQLLAALPDATPFRSGMKWGLKVGERILVPPIYRNLRPPVGQYCAVEASYSRWGIIALDGKVIVEPKYPEVAIADNGTAVLTSVTGKCISVKL